MASQRQFAGNIEGSLSILPRRGREVYCSIQHIGGGGEENVLSVWVDGSVPASAYLTFLHYFNVTPQVRGQPGCCATHPSPSHSGEDGTPSRDRLRLQVEA